MSAQGGWVNVPGKGQRWRMPDGSLRHVGPQGEGALHYGVGQAINWAMGADGGVPTNPQQLKDYQQRNRAALMGQAAPAASAPAPNPANNGAYQSKFAGNRDRAFNNARAGVQAGEPPSNPPRPSLNPAPPAPGPGPAQTSGGGALARVRNAAAALRAPAAAAAAANPIAPGARDLADAAGQLQALGLPTATGGEAPLQSYRQAPDLEVGRSAMQGWQPEPGAFDRPPVLPAPVDYANAPQVDFASAQLSFDPAGLAPQSGSGVSLEERRRRAFLDAPDSLEGMRRARLVMADEITSRGGDLQKLAADSNQMRPLSMKQLEGYLANLQNGTGAGEQSNLGTRAQNVQFRPASFDMAPLADAALSKGQDGLGAEAQNVNFRPAAFQMPRLLDDYMRGEFKQQLLSNPANANEQTLAYQTSGQVIPGVRGTPDENRLSSAAAAGVPSTAVTPAVVRDMYGAQNAIGLGLGAPKPGATVPLPQLSDEELQRAAALRSRWATPPAGFDFYNRR